MSISKISKYNRWAEWAHWTFYDFSNKGGCVFLHLWYCQPKQPNNCKARANMEQNWPRHNTTMKPPFIPIHFVGSGCCLVQKIMAQWMSHILDYTIWFCNCLYSCPRTEQSLAQVWRVLNQRCSLLLCTNVAPFNQSLIIESTDDHQLNCSITACLMWTRKLEAHSQVLEKVNGWLLTASLTPHESATDFSIGRLFEKSFYYAITMAFWTDSHVL